MNDIHRPRKHLVWLGNDLIVVTDLPGWQQCTARTGKGKRCKNVVQGDQTTGWAPVTVPGWGEVSVYDLSGNFHDADRWRAQRCDTHWPDGQAFTDPEWELFYPDIHADLHESTRPRKWHEWVLGEGVVLRQSTGASA